MNYISIKFLYLVLFYHKMHNIETTISFLVLFLFFSYLPVIILVDITIYGDFIMKQMKTNEITEGIIWKQLLFFFFPILLGSFFSSYIIR